jgi:hypothetical protein
MRCFALSTPPAVNYWLCQLGNWPGFASRYSCSMSIGTITDGRHFDVQGVAELSCDRTKPRVSLIALSPLCYARI